MNNGKITGVHDKEEDPMIDNLDQLQNWMYYLRAIYKKNVITAEIILEVQTSQSTYQLYKDQKEFCERII